MNQVTPELIAGLFDRHAASLELYAAQWTRAPADVVQEAFLKLARQPGAPERPVAWLYRVVRNGAISAARAEGRRVRNEKASTSGAETWFETAAADVVDSQTATQALRELNDDEREVVVARIWGGLKFDEIAEVAGISSSTAHRRYEAAIAALRERLGVSWLTKTASKTK